MPVEKLLLRLHSVWKGNCSCELTACLRQWIAAKHAEAGAWNGMGCPSPEGGIRETDAASRQVKGPVCLQTEP
jgi:hypothetical protein